MIKPVVHLNRRHSSQTQLGGSVFIITGGGGTVVRPRNCVCWMLDHPVGLFLRHGCGNTTANWCRSESPHSVICSAAESFYCQQVIHCEGITGAGEGRKSCRFTGLLVFQMCTKTLSWSSLYVTTQVFKLEMKRTLTRRMSSCDVQRDGARWWCSRHVWKAGRFLYFVGFLYDVHSNQWLCSSLSLCFSLQERVHRTVPETSLPVPLLISPLHEGKRRH